MPEFARNECSSSVSLSALPGVSVSALPGVSTTRPSHYIQGMPGLPGKAQIRVDATAPVGSGPASKDDRVRDQPSPGVTGYGKDGGTGTMHDRGSSSRADATQRHACPIRPSRYIQASHDLESGRTQDSNHSHVASMTGSVPVDANFGGNPSPIHMSMTMPGELRCDAYMCGATRRLLTLREDAGG